MTRAKCASGNFGMQSHATTRSSISRGPQRMGWGGSRPPVPILSFSPRNSPLAATTRLVRREIGLRAGVGRHSRPPRVSSRGHFTGPIPLGQGRSLLRTRRFPGSCPAGRSSCARRPVGWLRVLPPSPVGAVGFGSDGDERFVVRKGCLLGPAPISARRRNSPVLAPRRSGRSSVTVLGRLRTWQPRARSLLLP